MLAFAVPAFAQWNGFAHDAQHSAQSPAASQTLNHVLWSAPVDLDPQASGRFLAVHYGSPLITAANTDGGRPPCPSAALCKIAHYLFAPPRYPRARRPTQMIIACFPDWDAVIAGTKTPGEVRDESVFGHGIGWQAIAHAANVLIQTQSKTWEATLTAALKAIDWNRTNSDWQNVAMIGTRINNTGPGVRATANPVNADRFANPSSSTKDSLSAC